MKIIYTFVLVVLLPWGVKTFKNKFYNECIKDGDFQEKDVKKVGMRIDKKTIK